MGNLILLPCEASDAAEILEGQHAAFRNPLEPFFDCLFPEGEAKEIAVKRTLEWWLGDESARYMKVVDEETNEIVSAAKWCIYEKPLTEEKMKERIHVDWQADEDTNAWSEHIINWLYEHRYSQTKGIRSCFLDMLSTHPDHQRRGAGSMLMKWGTDIADTMGVEAFIEGTRYAKHLYEQNGFVSSDDWIIIPVPEKWKERPEIKFFWFERPVSVVVVPDSKEG